MKKEDLIILCQVYESIAELEKVVKVIQGEVYVSTLGVGIIGKISLIEKIILNNTLVELTEDTINDTYCSALYILYDETLTVEQKVEYLLGEKSIKDYRYKIY
ncbi:MAG: hypothetical protein IJZ36_01460 [Bacilli bacterium]|nr:hypothetical protein [Bacilli bacterium]